MNKEKVAALRETVEAIKEKLAALKIRATELCASVDAQELIPEAVSDELKTAFEDYHEQESLLKKLSDELSINIGTKLIDITEAIDTYEKKQSLAGLREVVLDYFRLNSEAADIKNALEKTKLDLVEKCLSSAPSLEEDISSYGLVVSAVKEKQHPLQKDIFQRIMNDVDFDVAFATDRGQLFIDENFDITRFANGKTPLLSATADNHGADVVNGNSPAGESLKSSDETGDHEVAPEEQANLWRNFNSYISPGIAISVDDITGELTCDTVKSMTTEDQDCLAVLWNVANEKLIGYRNVSAESHVYSGNAINLLKKNGLLVDLVIKENGIDDRFLTLSTKGWNVFRNREITEFFEAQNPPFVFSEKLSLSMDNWTQLMTSRARLLNRYFQTGNRHYVMWTLDEELPVAKPENSVKDLVMPCLMIKGHEESCIESINNVLGKIDVNVTLLVLDEQDVAVLEKAIKYEKKKCSYVVVSNEAASENKKGSSEEVLSEKTKDAPKAGKSDAREEEKTEPVVELLNAENSPKTNNPTASGFKKEVIGFSKQFREVFGVLPLFTNLGLLDREQILKFSVIMDCIEEDEDQKSVINATVDLLASKGMLAKYSFEGKEVFGLSPYCAGCLKKKEINSMPLWNISRGNRNVKSSKTVEVSTLKECLRTNEGLIKYLDAAKASLSDEEYASVKQSIRWNGDGYSVDYYDSGDKVTCVLDPDLTRELDGAKISIIISDDQTGLIADSEAYEKVYVIRDNLIYPWSNDSDNEDREDQTDLTAEKQETDEEETLTSGNDDYTPVVVKKESNSESKVDIVKKNVIPEKPSEEKVAGQNDMAGSDGLFEESDPEQLDLPEDDVFVNNAFAIINAPAENDKDVFTNVANALLLSRTAGFISGYSKSGKLDKQLQLATNMLLGGCTYSSKDLTSLFTGFDDNCQALALAAYSFAMLLPNEAYDYGLIAQVKSYFADFEGTFPDYPRFKGLFNKLCSLSDIVPMGFTPSIIASLGNDEERNNYEKTLRSRAMTLLSYNAPKTRMKALPIMYSANFGSGSDLHECMNIIANDKYNDADIVRTVLDEYCSETNGSLAIDDYKLNAKLDEAWNSANQKDKFKLEYDARAQALRQYRFRVELMLTWIEHVTERKGSSGNISRLKALRSGLLKEIHDLETDTTWKKNKCAAVLRVMLSRMEKYLNGEADNKKFFADILLTGYISMDEDWHPVLNESHTGIKYNEPWRNVIRHITANKKTTSEIVEDILEGEPDASSSFDNLNQLRMLGLWLDSDNEQFVVSEKQMEDAEKSALLSTKKFREDLELAYTYNQVNETEKETLSGIVRQNESAFFETGDYACWRRFLSGLRRQIEEFAVSRQEVLRMRLEELKKTAKDSALLNAAASLLEGPRNLAVAEEYINRFEGGETEITDELEAIVNDIPYFDEFVSSEVFNPLYELCKNRTGTALRNYGWSYLERRLPKEWSSRQRKDSEELVSSWPVRKDVTSAASIQKLFTLLGFNVTSASKASGRSKEEIFKLQVSATPRSKADYLHPIAAFGTQTKSPLNVVVLYGNYTEKQLVDTVSSLDLGGLAIVLIDRPIELASRRQIGEIFHTQTSGQNPFLLIDQVLLLYLAKHQITERLPAMLKCTLPYSSYQPFVQDSGSTADEMFCGRTMELARIIDSNGACVVYGGRQLGKTALLQRAESRCMNPESKSYAVYVSIINLDSEEKVVASISEAINKKTSGAITITRCKTIKELCGQLAQYFRKGTVARMHLLIDEVDRFLSEIAIDRYEQLQPLVDLRRETTNNFKFVIAGLHNVCRAKNATAENGIFGQLGTPLCIKPLSPTDAMQLLSRPLRYLGFQIDRYPHLETILTNTNYYPGIIQFFGYMLVETLNTQYSKYYRAAKGNPPFTLTDEQLGAIMNSADLNRSIKDKFRWSLELDKRYFMLARCITMLYHFYEDDRQHGSWLGFSVEQIMEMAEEYNIHCLENETQNDYIILLDEMVDMGILSKPNEGNLYRLRRSSFVDIIGENFDVLDAEIISSNEEV